MSDTEKKPLTSLINEPSWWTVLESSLEGCFDVGEHSDEYPEEGVMRFAITNDRKWAEYVVQRLNLLEQIRSWIFNPQEREKFSNDHDLLQKIGETLGWYEGVPVTEGWDV